MTLVWMGILLPSRTQFEQSEEELGTGSDFYWKSPKTKIGTVVHFFP